jgi:hypothetical protein
MNVKTRSYRGACLLVVVICVEKRHDVNHLLNRRVLNTCWASVSLLPFYLFRAVDTRGVVRTIDRSTFCSNNV